MNRKVITVAFSCLTVFSLIGNSVHATNTDKTINDIRQSSKAPEKQDNRVKVNSTSDNENLYVNIESNQLPNNFIINYGNKKLVFTYNSKANSAVPILMNGKTVGTGKINANGSSVAMKISLKSSGMDSIEGDTAQIIAGNGTSNVKIQGAVKETPQSTQKTAQEDKTDAKSISMSSSQPKIKKALAENNNVKGSLGIHIDGNFSDWDNISKSPMTINGDNDNIKYVALTADSENIYFYVMMHPVLSGGYTSFQPSGYVLNIGGKDFYITFNNGQTVNLNVGQSQSIPTGIYSTDGNVNLNGQAYVSNQEINQKMGDGTTVKGTGYVVECAIPLKELKGISNTGDQTISLSNGNLWTGEVTTTGGSTGPVLLAGTGFAIAALSVYRMLRKKRELG